MEISPLDLLTELHRTGQLAGRYPEVRGLLTDLAPPELLRAGRLLSRLAAADVLRSHPATPAVTVLITGHGTVAPLVPPLCAELARHGLLLRSRLDDFHDSILDLARLDQLAAQAAPDLTLCLLTSAAVLGQVRVPWTVADVADALEATVSFLDGLCARHRGVGTLVLNTLPLPYDVVAHLVDHRSRARLGVIWREANARLLRLGETHPSVVVIDLDPLIAEGIPATDARLASYADVRAHPELLARYAREIGQLARHLTGRTSKCLALDLDGTLWGGTLGEDGAERIEAGDGYRGTAFTAVQRLAKQWASQGVLVAAISKNDAEPVRQVLREHPGMTLREDDFVRVVANWRPKPDNLAELAAELNLGTDSFVFADDNPTECGLMAIARPEVAVVRLDGDPAEHVGRLLRDGWFTSVALTEEDRQRPAKYRQELARTDLLHSVDSTDAYLRELGLSVRVAAAGAADVSRVSQITLRTNQFNLTARRLQPDDVRRLLDDPEALVLTIRSADRFGDNGTVGAVFARRQAETMSVDNMLLSCRVFGRGIEQAALAVLLRHARDLGSRAVLASYRPTAKNGRFAGFYAQHGFAPIDNHADNDTAADNAEATGFQHDLAELPTVPEHIDLTVDL